MGARVRVPVAILTESEDDIARRREIDAMLSAIAKAIASGELPPDDAAAWARIAAFEVGVRNGDPRGR